MYPAARRARIFTANGIEREFFSPHRGRGPITNLCKDAPTYTAREALLLVNVFDVSRKDAGFHVRASCGE
jgi:hypothetical protein